MAVLAVAALCAGTVVASEKACPMSKKDAKCTMKCTISGTVEAVDAAANKLSVKTAAAGEGAKAEVKEFTLDANTRVKIGKKTATLAEVVAGQEVDVVCKGEVVKSVMVKTAKGNLEKQMDAEKKKTGERDLEAGKLKEEKSLKVEKNIEVK
jgi:hypothetical protein